MKKTLIALAILGLVGCSAAQNSAFQSNVQNFINNMSAADCHDSASIQTFVNNLPAIPLNPLNGTQMVAIFTHYCTGKYGPIAAPVPAPGNVVAFPTVTVAPSVAPVSSPVAK